MPKGRGNAQAGKLKDYEKIGVDNDVLTCIVKSIIASSVNSC